MTDHRRLRTLPDPDHLPALKPAYAHARPALGLGPLDPPPRVLLLYGSLRERSFSRLAVEEAARLLQFFGCETRIFDPSDLPLPDQVSGDDHPAVHELREHSLWSEGQVWCSPERHGQITGIMKTQIDHLPLAYKGLRPTQGRTLAVMQVSAGSQSFNSVNSLRILGRFRSIGGFISAGRVGLGLSVRLKSIFCGRNYLANVRDMEVYSLSNHGRIRTVLHVGIQSLELELSQDVVIYHDVYY